MNKKIVLPVILLVFLVGAIVWFIILSSADTVTTRVVLTGSEGLSVMGHYTADGKAYSVEEILPAEISVSAKWLSLLVESPEPAEMITAEVFVNGKYEKTGSQRQIEIMVIGDTMFSPFKVELRAFNESSEN